MLEDYNETIEIKDEKASVWSHSSFYGLILGGILVVITITVQAAGLSEASWTRYITYIVVIGMIIVAQRAFKDKGDSFMSYGQGIGIGTVVGLIASTVNAIFLYVYLKFVNSEMIEEMKIAQLEALKDQGYDQDTIEQTMELTEIVMKPGPVSLIGLVTLAFMTFVISLIITIFTRKENPNKDFN